MFSYCRNCGKPIRTDSNTCRFCGVKADTKSRMFCSYCGASTFGEKIVCPNCNEYIPGSLQKRPKSKRVAGLLAIFLGCFGMHKFYLGYFREGLILFVAFVVLSRFFGGMFGILINFLTIIEGIIYLKISDKSFEEQYVIEQRKWF